MPLGPNFWTYPIFDDAAAVPALVLNGMSIEGLKPTEFSSAWPEQGIVVETASGLDVLHHGIEDPLAPLSLGRRENEYTIQLQTLEHLASLQFLVGQARAGLSSLWEDAWIIDQWRGDGTATEFVLSRALGYGSTGVSFATRGAAAWLDTIDAAGSLPVVSGTPAAGQIGISTSTDATSITAGTAPTASETLIFLYHPLRTVRAELEVGLEGRNDGEATLSITEVLPLRNFAP